MNLETIYRGYLILIVIGSFISGNLIFYSFNRRKIPGSVEFCWMIGSMFIWLTTSLFMWMTSDLNVKQIWEKIGYIGVVSLPVFWVFLSSRYTGFVRWLTIPVRVGLFIIPLITLYYVFSGIFWESVTIEQIGDLQAKVVSFNPYFWVHVGYSYALVILGSVLILKAFIGFLPRQRRQSIGILLGAFLPFVINIIYVSKIIPEVDIDLTPLGFLFSCLLYAWSVFRTRLFNLVPIATQLVIEQMNDGMIVINENLEVVRINQAGLSMLGKSEAEIYGRSINALVPEIIQSTVNIPTASSNVVFDIEFSRSTEKQHYELRIQPIYEKVDDLIGYLLVFHDTTRYKRYESELIRLNSELEGQVVQRTKDLYESMSHFRDLVEKSGVGVYLYQLNRFIYVNETFANLVGYSVKDLLSRISPKDLFTEEDWIAFQKKVDVLTDDMQLLHWVIRGRHSSGRSIYMDFYGNQTVYRSKWALIGTVIDLSERLGVEEQLRQSEERYRLQVELFPYLVAVLVNREIIYINPAGAQMLGEDQPERLIGLSFDTFLREEDRDEFYRSVSDPQKTSSVSRLDRVWIQKNGTPVDVSFTNRTYFYRNRPAVQVVAHDITQRKQAEHRLELITRSGLEMNKFLETREVLGVLFTLLKQSIPIDNGQVLIMDHQHNILEYRVDMDGKLKPLRPFSSRNRRKTMLEEIKNLLGSKDYLYAPNLEEKPSVHLRTGGKSSQSYLVLPIRFGTENIGYFALGKDSSDCYTQNHIQIAQALSIPASIAVQNAQLFQQVLESSERLKVLSNRLVEVQELEKRDLAHELHDEIGQELTGLQFTLEKCKHVRDADLVDHLNLAQSLVSEIMGQVRNMSLNLRPRMLDDLGLLPTLEWLFDRYTTQTQVQVKFIHSGVNHRFPPDVEIAAFRIIQEALTNVARHSKAKHVEVSIQLVDQHLLLSILDRGVGFNYDELISQSKSGGLTSMVERASIVGGWVKITSSTGNGTRINVDLPLKKVIREKAYEYNGFISG